MYLDVHFHRQKEKILVAEIINGKIITKEYPVPYVFYFSHNKGSYKSIFGDPCKKFITHDGNKFRKELARISSPVANKEPLKIFESDIRPEFRCLAENYMGAEAPKLNVGFFDIETDFDPVNGFASTDDPFNAITAISLYKTANQKIVTLVLCPKTLTLSEAQEFCSEFEDTYVFDNEKELLRVFLDLIQDVHLLSGWNCIPLSNNIWLTDKIKKLSDVKPSDKTLIDGKIINYHLSGIKKQNRIILENGQTVLASDEHRIPIMQKSTNSYVYPSTLSKTRQDFTVSGIKSLLNSGKQIYMETRLRKNDNEDYTIRKYLEEFLPELMKYDYFDIAITDKNLKNKALNSLSIEERNTRFPNRGQRTLYSVLNNPKKWSFKNFNLPIKDLLEQIKENEEIKFVFKQNNVFSINLDQKIEPNILQVMGLLFTDGSFWRKRPEFTIYGTDEKQMKYYRDIVMSQPHKINALKKLVSKHDGIETHSRQYIFKIKRGSIFGLLAPMIYDVYFKKSINVNMLSCLSEEQFYAFYSGLIDGDGYVTKDALHLCNFDNNISNVQELLAWNGVYSNALKNLISVRNNSSFFEKLTLKNTKRAEKLSNVKIYKKINSPAKLLRKYIFDDYAFIRVREIVEEQAVEMGDIETENNYFISNGIRVHNSTFYDIPYIINRITKILTADDTKRLCLWDQKPKARKLKKFKREHNTYELIGRVHLDYLELYQKHNTQQLHSYRLDFVAETEIGEHKTPYDGSLDELYNNDFRKFIEYNRQDVMLLVKIDEKKKFIDLANQIAHDNCVPLKTTMGTVALVEQAIDNEMHAMGFVVPSRKTKLVDITEDEEDEEDEDTPVVGAYVADPRTGLQEEVGCIDINSLYPSVIRALNMSPETIFGQIRATETNEIIAERVKKLGKAKRAEAWEGVFQLFEVGYIHEKNDRLITIDFNDESFKTMSAGDWYNYIFNPKNNLCISANGTLFKTDKEGIIPKLLAKWYADRLEIQDKKNKYQQLLDGIFIDEDLINQLPNFLKGS